MPVYTIVHHVCHCGNSFSSCNKETHHVIPVTQLTEIKDYMSNYVSIMTIAHRKQVQL